MADTFSLALQWRSTLMAQHTSPTEVAQYRAACERLADLTLRGAEAVPLIHR